MFFKNKFEANPFPLLIMEIQRSFGEQTESEGKVFSTPKPDSSKSLGNKPHKDGSLNCLLQTRDELQNPSNKRGGVFFPSRGEI